jgi:hypothetical protein
VDVNIEAGEAGLEEDHPIELEDDEPEAGSLVVGRQGNVKVEPTGSAPSAGNAVAEIVDEIAEAQVCEVETLSRPPILIQYVSYRGHSNASRSASEPRKLG